MKTILLSVLFLTAITISVAAQKGKNEIGIGAEIAFPTGPFGESFKTGFGAWAKFLFGVSTKAQISFSTGYTGFSANGSGSEGSASVGILPLLLGYRHIISKGLYIEPQAGYGTYHAKVKIQEQSVSGSQGAFTYALGLGYVVNDVDFGIRYQNATIDGSDFSNVAIRIGYNFAFQGRSSK